MTTSQDKFMLQMLQAGDRGNSIGRNHRYRLHVASYV